MARVNSFATKGKGTWGKADKDLADKVRKEEVELDEAATPQMKKAAASIEAYAKKSGGIDKADFMKAAKMLSSGNAGSNFIKFVDDLDTEPREWLITNLAKTMGKQTVEKMFKVKIREEVELDEDLAADIRREKEKQARNKARTATANTEIDRNKATDKLHKMGLNRSMDRAKHYDARMKLSGLRKEAAPKIDDKKYSEYMASRQKPVRQSSTKKSLADIRKKAEIYKKEEINLSKKEEIFEANEQTLNTLLEKIHNHVLNGEDYKTVINEITTIGNFGWSSRELTELYIEKYVDINEEINSSLAALYEKHVNEGELTDIAKERIAREKQRDKIKHLQMIARAKVKDLKKEDTPSDREWGTDSLTAKYKKDTPGQND